MNDIFCVLATRMLGPIRGYVLYVDTRLEKQTMSFILDPSRSGVNIQVMSSNWTQHNCGQDSETDNVFHIGLSMVWCQHTGHVL
jgi:hypothetical protein